MNNYENISLSRDEKMWAMFCHLSSLIIFLGIPFGNIIGPLVIWILKKDSSPFVDRQGKESLNFQISMTIYILVSIVLVLLLVGIFMLIAIAIIDIVLVVVASVKANDGVDYAYPFTIRFFK